MTVAEVPTLEAKVRTDTGKGVARKLRAQGLLPGVLYGKNHQATPVVVSLNALRKALHHKDGIHTKIKLVLKKESGEETLDVVVQEYQAHPVNDKPLHVDFLVLYPDVPIKRTVPLRFVGRPVGVQKGGKLFIYRKEVTIKCLPQHLVSEVVVDISGLDLAQSLRVKDLPYPEGVEPVFKDNFSVVYIKPYKAEEVAEEGEEEAAAPAEAEQKPEGEGSGEAGE